MKSFKQYISEEWIGGIYPSHKTYNEMIFFKNPDSTEMREYMKEIPEYDVGGLIHKNDLYMFRGSHDTVVDLLGIRGKEIRFRATKRGNKLVNLEPTGGVSLTYVAMGMDREYDGPDDLVNELVQVYKNKYLKPYFDTPEKVFNRLKTAMYDGEDTGHPDQLNALLKKHGIRTNFKVRAGLQHANV